MTRLQPRSVMEEVSRIVLWTMAASLGLGALIACWCLLLNTARTDAWLVTQSLFALALHCGTTLIFLKDTRADHFPLPALLCIAVTAANFVVFLTGTWFSYNPARVWMQTALLVAAAVLIGPSRALFRKGTFLTLAWCGFIVIGIAAGICIWVIWDRSYRHATALSGTSMAVAVASTLSLSMFAFRSHDRLATLRIAMLIVIAMATGLVSLFAFDAFGLDSEAVGRVALLFSIIAVCGVGIHAALARLLRTQSIADAHALTIELRCPKCREELVQPTGSSACPHCRTRFEIRVIPIACIRCGYDISNLRNPTCPECGAAY